MQLRLESLVSLLNKDAGADGDEKKGTSDDCDDNQDVGTWLVRGRDRLVGLSLFDNPVLSIEAEGVVGVFEHCVVTAEECITEKISVLSRCVLSVNEELANILLSDNI